MVFEHSLPEIAQTPLIIMSSFGQIFSTAELEKIGISVYVIKPVKQSMLYDCITVALRKNTVNRVATETHTEKNDVVPIVPLEAKSVKILIAEDNSINQQVILLFL